MAQDVIRCPGCGVNMDLSGFSIRPEQVVCPRCHTRSIVPPLYYPAVSVQPIEPQAPLPYGHYVPGNQAYEQPSAAVPAELYRGVVPVEGFSQPMMQSVPQSYYAPQPYHPPVPYEAYDPAQQPFQQQLHQVAQQLVHQPIPPCGIGDQQYNMYGGTNTPSYRPMSAAQNEFSAAQQQAAFATSIPHEMYRQETSYGAPFSNDTYQQQAPYRAPLSDEGYQEEAAYPVQTAYGQSTGFSQQQSFPFVQSESPIDISEQNNGYAQMADMTFAREDELYPLDDAAMSPLEEVEEVASAIEPIMPLTDAFDLFDEDVDADFVSMMELDSQEGEADDSSFMDTTGFEIGGTDGIPVASELERADEVINEKVQEEASLEEAIVSERIDLSENDQVFDEQVVDEQVVDEQVAVPVDVIHPEISSDATPVNMTSGDATPADTAFANVTSAEERVDVLTDDPIMELQVNAPDEVFAFEECAVIPSDVLAIDEQSSVSDGDLTREEHSLVAEDALVSKEQENAPDDVASLDGLASSPSVASIQGESVDLPEPDTTSIAELQVHEPLQSDSDLSTPPTSTPNESFLLPIDKSGNAEPFAFALIGFLSTITMIPLLGLTLCIVALALSYREKKRNLYSAYRGATLFFAIIGIIVNAAFLLFQIILMISLATAPAALIGMFY